MLGLARWRSRILWMNYTVNGYFCCFFFRKLNVFCKMIRLDDIREMCTQNTLNGSSMKVWWIVIHKAFATISISPQIYLKVLFSSLNKTFFGVSGMCEGFINKIVAFISALSFTDASSQPTGAIAQITWLAACLNVIQLQLILKHFIELIICKMRTLLINDPPLGDISTFKIYINFN